MSKLAAFTAHLQGQFQALGIKPEQYDAFQEGGELRAGGGKETEQGWHLASWEYRAAIVIERMPTASAGLLLALVQVWLDEHDPEREKAGQKPPQIHIDMDDRNQLADIEITLDFEDELYLAPNVNGAVVWRGQRYDFGEHDLWVAENLVDSNGAVKVSQ